MDIDEFIRRRQPDWDRLQRLTRPPPRSAAEVDEFVSLYRRASSDLSHARAEYADPDLDGYLTRIVSGASARLYQRTESPVAGIRRFFGQTFPGAVWHIRYYILVSALLFFGPWLAVGLWSTTDPVVLETIAPESARGQYVNGSFIDYYQGGQSTGFAFGVTINNIQVAFLAWALGITLGLGTIFVLVSNGLNIGGAWSAFIAEGVQPRFWTLILPHGLLELTAIVVAGGAGLAVGWSIVRPGDRTRSKSFTHAAQRSISVVIGLMVVFLAAGMIEGFVTGRPWSAWLRIGIGAAAEVLVLSYWYVNGSRAADDGFTGLWSDRSRGEDSQRIVKL